MFNPQWPIRTYRYDGPATKVGNLDISDSIVGAGCLIEAAKVSSSVIGLEVVLERDVEIEDCIIHDYVKIEKGSKCAELSLIVLPFLRLEQP